MSRAHARNEIQTSDLVKLHLDGMSITDIARKFEMTKQAVDQRFDAYGYKPVSSKELVKQYIDLPVKEIKEKTKLSDFVVRYHLKKLKARV